MPTPISATNTIGVKYSRGNSLASCAPSAEPTAAEITNGNTVRQSGLILIAYVIELVAVPHTEETLFVPRIAAGGVSGGNAMSRAGSWINPPPPTTASTHPALKAASTSIATTQ